MPTIKASGDEKTHEYSTAGRRLFECPISWTVSGADSGFIVQHIQRNEKQTARTVPFAKDSDLTVVIPNEYWEAWEIIGPNNAVYPQKGGIHDNFSIGLTQGCIYINGPNGPEVKHRPTKENTDGRWKIRGQVYYVSAEHFDLPHWYRAKPVDGASNKGQLGAENRALAVAEAGMLLSRYKKPVPGDGLSGTGTLGNVVLTRKFAGKWKFCLELGEIKSHTARSFPGGAKFASLAKGF